MCRDGVCPQAACSPSRGLTVLVFCQDGFCAVLPCPMDQLFLWGPDCPSQWRKACGGTEEELAPRRAPGVGAGGHGLWSMRRVPQPPGCSLLEFVLDLLSCRSWLTGATPFFPSWRPLGNQ
uniref:Uncharacterized protein n=1 Tax=Myotis myotis TaxID=51298 RepID=A0A7J7Y057_MYOMY|nr:hypothetical protein mMyoMyo1_011529 [Myotis myotis]